MKASEEVHCGEVNWNDRGHCCTTSMQPDLLLSIAFGPVSWAQQLPPPLLCSLVAMLPGLLNQHLSQDLFGFVLHCGTREAPDLAHHLQHIIFAHRRHGEVILSTAAAVQDLLKHWTLTFQIQPPAGAYSTIEFLPSWQPVAAASIPCVQGPLQQQCVYQLLQADVNPALP